MKTVSVEAPQRLLLGIQGEHLTNAIAFDFAPWQNRYGAGSIQLQVQRCGEDAPYPVPLQVDGNLAVWHIERRDTEKEGYGELQLLYIVNGEQVEKSNVFTTVVQKGLSQPGPVPPEEHNFLDQVVAEAAKAELAAKNAEKAAQQTAKDAAQTAEDRTASEQAKDQAIEAAGAAAKDKAAAEGAAKTAVETVAGFDQHAATQKEQLTQLVAQEKQAVSQLGTEEREQIAILGSQVKESIAKDKADAQAAAEQTKRDANAVSKAAGVVAQQAEATQKAAADAEGAAGRSEAGAAKVEETVTKYNTDLVERLCTPFSKTGLIATCHPVAGHPLHVVSQIQGNAICAKLMHCGANMLALKDGSHSWQPGVNVEYKNGEIIVTGIPKSNDVALSFYKDNFFGIQVNGSLTFSVDRPVEVARLELRIKTDIGGQLTKTIAKGKTSVSFTVNGKIQSVYFLAIGATPNEPFELHVKPQLQAGNAALPYEIFHGNEYTADFGETVEAGTYDWTTGLLTVTAPTPHTKQLAPQQILPPSGMNTVYSSTGDTTVEGRVDPVYEKQQLRDAIVALGPIIK